MTTETLDKILDIFVKAANGTNLRNRRMAVQGLRMLLEMYRMVPNGSDHV